MERELTRLLLEYEELKTAWPKCPHVLVRASAGRQATDALARIADLEHAIRGRELGCVHEAAHEVAVDQKVLAEPFARAQARRSQPVGDLAFGLNVCAGHQRQRHASLDGSRDRRYYTRESCR